GAVLNRLYRFLRFLFLLFLFSWSRIVNSLVLIFTFYGLVLLTGTVLVLLLFISQLFFIPNPVPITIMFRICRGEARLLRFRVLFYKAVIDPFIKFLVHTSRRHIIKLKITH